MTLPTEDVVAIQQLVAEYAHAFDSGDGAAVAACFVPDGSLDSGVAVVGGRDALAAMVATMPELMPGGRHVVSNVHVSGEGDDANVRMYLQVFLTAGGAERTTLLLSGRYDDTVRRENGTWRFVSRVMTADA
jgi:uncharacterized protein (TIGR02246 family)